MKNFTFENVFFHIFFLGGGGHYITEVYLQLENGVESSIFVIRYGLVKDLKKFHFSEGPFSKF
jgi:hypothetical protein